MSSPGNSSSAIEAHRFVISAGVVVLSIALPVAIICCTVYATFSGWTGRPSNVQKIYQGSVKNGELWFSEFECSSNDLIYDHRIWRLNLETGVERPTDLLQHNESGYSIWLNDDFYVVSPSAIYEMIGSDLTKLVNRPIHSSGFHSIPFLDENRLTMIAETPSGGFRLVHLENGQWQDGREIVLPGPGRTWYDDAECQCKRLLPLSSEQPIAVAARPLVMISAVEVAGQFHLFQTDLQTFSAYRQGFEFADETFDSASAIAVENSVREATGWESIQPNGFDQSWMWMLPTPQGPVFANSRSPGRIARRNQNGRWETIAESNDVRDPILVSDSDGMRVYAIVEDQRWSSANIHRVEGNSILPAHIQLPGHRREYVSRWQRLTAGVLIAWLIHWAVLIAGTSRLQSSPLQAHYEFGDQQVMLATILQRSMAFLIDLLFCLLILSVPIYFHFLSFGYAWNQFTLTDTSEFLLRIEREVHSLIRSGVFLPLWSNIRSWIRVAVPSYENSTLMIAVFSEVLTVFMAMVLVEGWSGTTPGKWLLRLRTVAVTLRPCGLLPLLLRNVMYWFDVAMFISPIPAAISIMASPCRQRLGDRLAGTVVIRPASTQKAVTPKNP